MCAVAMNSDGHGQERGSMFYSLADSLEEPAIIIDDEFTIVHANNTYRRIYGYHDDGKKCYQISHGFDSPCVVFGEECPWALLNSGKPPKLNFIEQFHAGNTLKNKVGVNYYPLADSTGNTGFLLIVIRDSVNETDEKADIYPLKTIEKNYLRNIFENHRGDNKNLADKLGISERTLYRKLKSFARSRG